MRLRAKNIFRLSVAVFSAFLLFTSVLPQYAYGLTLSPNTSSEEDSQEDDDTSSTSSGTTSSSTKNSNTEQLNNLKDEYEQLEKELKEIEQNIKSINNEKTQTIAEQNSISRKIDISTEQLKILEEKITLINEEIKKKEEEISAKQSDIDQNYDLFKVRVRALYMTDTSSVINIIFGAQSFSDFLERSEYIKRVTDHDDALIDQLKTDKADIEAAKAEVDAAKAELEQSQADEAQKKKELDGQLSKVSAEVALLKQTEAEFYAHKAEKEQDMKETQAELDRIYAQMESIGEYVGGEFTWPVPGFSSISSYYGWRFNGADFHTGIDITGSGVYGHSIVAANKGKVSFVQTSYTPGKGYGKYVIIDHGGGRTTLYGHMSAINVSLDQWVDKGEKIGEVGSTGNSTGPHLHFEIRIDGKHTNPMNYFQKS